MKIHHIGYAVKDLQKSKRVFQELGYQQEYEIVADESRHLNILFMKGANGRVELLEELTDNTTIAQFLKKNGCCPYHICYECSDLNGAIEKYKKDGWLVVNKISYAVALKGNVCFLYHKDVGLVELVDFKAEENYGK